MKDLGPTKQFLGIKIIRDRCAKKLWLFNIDKVKVISCPLANHFRLKNEEMDKVPYVLAVGSLMYAMVFTQPDIAYSVGVVSRFLLNRDTKPMLVGYIDADMAGDVDSRKSTSRYLITFSRGVVSCQSKYQLFCDSQCAIHIGKNSSFHSRSKRIDVRYHWIRDVLEMKLLQLEKIHTDENGSDMLMKILPREKFELC
ncbi:hypothetical protein AAG906_032860 [Vitis piasezkii]